MGSRCARRLGANGPGAGAATAHRDRDQDNHLGGRHEEVHGGVTLSYDPAANLSEQILGQGADDAMGYTAGSGLWFWNGGVG